MDYAFFYIKCQTKFSLKCLKSVNKNAAHLFVFVLFTRFGEIHRNENFIMIQNIRNFVAFSKSKYVCIFE